MINENLVLNNQYKTKGVFMFWTMIDKRERTPLYDQYEKVLDVFALQKMETHIPYRSRFNKEILLAGDPVSRSTVFPSDKTFLADSMVEELAKEIGSILKFGQ